MEPDPVREERESSHVSDEMDVYVVMAPAITVQKAGPRKISIRDTGLQENSSIPVPLRPSPALKPMVQPPEAQASKKTAEANKGKPPQLLKAPTKPHIYRSKTPEGTRTHREPPLPLPKPKGINKRMANLATTPQQHSKSLSENSPFLLPKEDENMSDMVTKSPNRRIKYSMDDSVLVLPSTTIQVSPPSKPLSTSPFMVIGDPIPVKDVAIVKGIQIPQLYMAENSFSGPPAVEKGQVLMMLYKKSATVIKGIDANGRRFIIPHNSLTKISPIFKESGVTKPMKAKDLLSCKSLPAVVKVVKSFSHGKGQKVPAGALLFLEDTCDKKGKIFCINARDQSGQLVMITSDCSGTFSTRTKDVQLYMIEVVRHHLQLPQRVRMHESKEEVVLDSVYQQEVFVAQPINAKGDVESMYLEIPSKAPLTLVKVAFKARSHSVPDTSVDAYYTVPQRVGRVSLPSIEIEEDGEYESLGDWTQNWTRGGQIAVEPQPSTTASTSPPTSESSTWKKKHTEGGLTAAKPQPSATATTSLPTSESSTWKKKYTEGGQTAGKPQSSTTTSTSLPTSESSTWIKNRTGGGQAAAKPQPSATASTSLPAAERSTWIKNRVEGHTAAKPQPTATASTSLSTSEGSTKNRTRGEQTAAEPQPSATASTSLPNSETSTSLTSEYLNMLPLQRLHASGASATGTYEEADERRKAENKAYLKQLKVDEVLQLLEAMQLETYKESFKKELIDGEMLSSLTEEDLRRELNIQKRLHRVRLLKVIEGIYSAQEYLSELYE